MPEPHLRAADSDRAAVAAALGEHMAAGRLTLAEYDERVSRAYAAKTYGDLGQLTTDLPPLHDRSAPGAQPVHAGSSAPTYRAACGARYRGAADAWRAWLTTAVIVGTIWLLASLSTGQFLFFWPIWVVGPWAALLLVQTLGGGRRHGRRAGTRTGG
jgi:hypothetical protein